MNKNINLTFSIIGLFAEIYFLTNAFNIWVHHIGISFADIVNSLFSILAVVIGVLLTIVSMIFYKNNYKATNIINYISIALLVISVIFLGI